LIEEANKLRGEGIKIISYDLPSGMNPDTGVCGDPCISADYTMTLALPKTGLRGAKNIGKLYLVNIGIPNELYSGLGLKVGGLFGKGDVVLVEQKNL